MDQLLYFWRQMDTQVRTINTALWILLFFLTDHSTYVLDPQKFLRHEFSSSSRVASRRWTSLKPNHLYIKPPSEDDFQWQPMRNIWFLRLVLVTVRECIYPKCVGEFKQVRHKNNSTLSFKKGEAALINFLHRLSFVIKTKLVKHSLL